jgi:ferredoxin
MKITNDCMACGSCEEICPNEAIHPKNSDDGYSRMDIDANKCSNCGACLEQANCPGDAITKD